MMSIEDPKAVSGEEFIELARRTAGNAQGLRPLARHVRKLYDAIRALQEDDNSFFYVADIIREARRDQTDPIEFMIRVKTYHHRDRTAKGDPLISRGMARRTEVVRESGVTGEVAGSFAAPPKSPVVAPEPGPPPVSRAADGEAATRAEFLPPADGKNEARDYRPGLTAALHSRPGRRRTVPGG